MTLLKKDIIYKSSFMNIPVNTKFESEMRLCKNLCVRYEK